MTPQFITPCYVRVDDPIERQEICEKLHLIGYKHLWDSNEQFKSAIYADTDDLVVRMLRNADGLGIDCGTNTDLFLALAGMRSDTDYMQWFTDGKHWYKNISQKKEIGGEFIIDGYLCHKATAQEIIEHFNKKGEKE